MQRFGMTIPFDRIPLSEHREWFKELEDLGYTDVWSSEANGTDAFTPLVLAAAWTSNLRLGTAIVPAYTRGPATLAQQIASLSSAAPGRVAFGIGTSSNVIVERWNGIEFAEPFRRTRDMVRFLRSALDGEKTDFEGSGVSSHGFRLDVSGVTPVPIMVAALRPQMLRLAAREGDGAIINWLSAEDVSTVAGVVKEAGGEKEIVARIFVAPDVDREVLLRFGKVAIAAYLNVGVYAAFHDWLGRSEMLQPMWDAWNAGDRAGALDAIPEQLVDELIVSGSPEECREHIQRYVDNGVTTPVVALLPFGFDQRAALRALAPSATR